MQKNIVETDVLVLGAGPAGYTAAFRSADLGLKTVLVENYKNLGGVCLNVGCIPSKTFLHISKLLREVKNISNSGISFSSPLVNIKKMVEWKDKIVSDLSDGLMFLAKNKNVKILRGMGKFVTHNQIRVFSSKKEEILVNFRYAIIATGSRSNTTDIFSKIHHHENIWYSTDALKIPFIPKRLLIVGSGIIGLEMATFYSSIGTKVEIIENSSTLLPFMDRDIVNIFLREIKSKFSILFNSKIKTIKVEGKEVVISIKNRKCLSTEKKNCILKSYDAVLICIGRVPNVENINLDRINIKLDKSSFIKVNKRLQTNVSNIYAVGDVTGFPMLAHKGIYQAHIAAEVISGKKYHIYEPKVIPCVSYTDPEIGWVGILEEEAIRRKISFGTALIPWNTLGKAAAMHCTYGATKLLFDKKDNKIIGGIVIGPNSGEILGEISLAIEMCCNVEDISLTMHAHPTLYESIRLVADMFQGNSTDILNKKK